MSDDRVTRRSPVSGVKEPPSPGEAHTDFSTLQMHLADHALSLLQMGQRQPTSAILRVLLMVVVTAGAAICFPAIKLGLEFSPPLEFAGLRTLFAGFALLAVTLLMRQGVWLPKKLSWWLAPLGLTAGVTFIATRPSGSVGANGLIGAMLALLSSLSAAGSSIMFKKLRPGKNLLALTGSQMVAGSLPLFGLSFFFERHVPVQWNLQFTSVLLTLAAGIQVGSYLEGEGRALFELTNQKGMEGIIAKRKNSLYRPGMRTSDWLKIKARLQQEFVVGGFTEGKGSRQRLGALLLANFTISGIRVAVSVKKESMTHFAE